jgi:hypothetical protein
LREEVLRRGDLTPRNLLALAEADAESRLNRIKHLLGHGSKPSPWESRWSASNWPTPRIPN